MNLEREVRQAITGQHPEPVDVPDIMNYVDFVQRVVISRDELNEALLHLVTEGVIRELPGRRYVDATAGIGSSTFTPITDEEHRAADAEYRRRFAEMVKKASDQANG